MKTKKITAIILASALIFSLSACGKKANSQNTATNTKTEESQKSSEKKIAELKAKINELSDKENKILEANKELWDRLFKKVDQEEKATTLMDDGRNYAEYLGQLVEKYKADFTEDELNKLKDDLQKISEIDAEIMKLEKELNSLEDKVEASGEKTSSSESGETFPEFKGKDLDGNDVDSSTFANHSVTVVNFWFSGCAPCVAELKDLDKLNEDLKARGGQVIGINTETLDGNEEGIAGAKEIIDAKGVKYQNIYFDSSSEAGRMALSITGFPTTILVNRQGKIINQSLLGGIDNKKNYNSLMSQIDEIIKADQK